MLVTVGLQLVVGAVLARQLLPTDFGLVAMAGVALRFGQYFAQMGIGSAMVQKHELSRDEIGAGFWSSLGLGAAFAVVFMLVAPLVGHLFANTRVVPVIRILALSFVLSALCTTSLSLLRRDLRFKAVAVVEIVGYVVGYGVVALIMAFMGAGVWSLVAGALVQSGIAAVGYYVACRHPIPLATKRVHYVYLWSFGSRVSAVGFLEFLSTNIDTLAVGRFLGDAALGMYNRAYNLAYLPAYQVMQGMTRVLQSSFSRTQKEAERLRRGYLSAVLVLAAVAIPLSWGIAAASTEIVAVFLGSRWSGAVLPVAIMAIAAPFSALTRLSEVIAEALGELNQKMIIRFVQLLALGAFVAVGLRFGIRGPATAFAVVEIAAFVAYARLTSRLTSVAFGDIACACRPGLIAAGLVCAFVYSVHYFGGLLVIPAGLLLVLQFTGAAVLLLFSVARVEGGRVWNEILPYVDALGISEGTIAARLVDRIDRRWVAGGSRPGDR